jgi:hypothetical protein
VWFRTSASDCNPEHLDLGWAVLGRGRVVDEDEASDIDPHEWRDESAGELTLSECQVRKNAFLGATFGSIKTIILPRQAWDKHREKLRERE